MENRDIYATLASVGLGYKYEDCLEFELDANGNKTDKVNPEGKKRRSIGKILVLGINYGMSTPSIAELVFGDRDDMTEKQKLSEAQKIQDQLVKNLPQLQKCIHDAQVRCAKTGYTETILGRRRHLPNMQLPKFEFSPEKGYMNPDVDPLDPETMKTKDQIPQRIIDALVKEFNGYKYFGDVVKRTKELKEEHIKVTNNTFKIEAAKREVFNGIIQGSAAELTKMAMLKLEHDPEWKRIGGKFILPVHDELIAEVPYEYRKEGAEALARCMQSAGDFFPFPLTCDVETSFRWYGLGVDEIDSFDRPESLCNLSESNIMWLQCMLVECEYALPKHPPKDGSKLFGIAAEGVDGIWSDEMDAAIADYKKHYGLKSDSAFIQHIEAKVCRGVYLKITEEAS